MILWVLIFALACWVIWWTISADRTFRRLHAESLARQAALLNEVNK